MFFLRLVKMEEAQIQFSVDIWNKMRSGKLSYENGCPKHSIQFHIFIVRITFPCLFNWKTYITKLESSKRYIFRLEDTASCFLIYLVRSHSSRILLRKFVFITSFFMHLSKPKHFLPRCQPLHCLLAIHSQLILFGKFLNERSNYGIIICYYT